MPTKSNVHHKNTLSDCELFLEKTKNSSGDETANVNFLYDDIVHVLESCINCGHRSTLFVATQDIGLERVHVC